MKTCNFTNGTRWDNWYNLSDIQSAIGANETKLKIYVIGQRDAYILLSPEIDPSSGSPAYEICKFKFHKIKQHSIQQ